jgi:hypothetical protein
MENNVVGGKWFGPVDGLLCGFWLGLTPILSLFVINSRNSQETNSN